MMSQRRRRCSKRNKKLRISLPQLLWFYYSIFLEGDNKEEELEEGEEGEIYFCTLSVILKVSKFLVCSVIRNLLLAWANHKFP